MGFGVIAVRPNSFGERVRTSSPICVVTPVMRVAVNYLYARSLSVARGVRDGVYVSVWNELEIQTETLTKIHTFAMKRNESGHTIFVNLRIYGQRTHVEYNGWNILDLLIQLKLITMCLYKPV